MIKVVNFDLPTLFKEVDKRSVEVPTEVKSFDEMIEKLITIGVSALNFDILTEDNLEQYRAAHVEIHDCRQLIYRIQSLPSTKLELNILF